MLDWAQASLCIRQYVNCLQLSQLMPSAYGAVAVAVLCALRATCADVALFLRLEVTAAGAFVKVAHCDRCQQWARTGFAMIIFCGAGSRGGVVRKSGVLGFASIRL